MKFTQAELRFLVGHHSRLASVENVDFSSCPEPIFQRIMEARAKKLGPVFEAFRKEQAPHVGPLPTQPDLNTQIASSKLF